jgi:hypothetical protein
MLTTRRIKIFCGPSGLLQHEVITNSEEVSLLLHADADMVVSMWRKITAHNGECMQLVAVKLLPSTVKAIVSLLQETAIQRR